MIIDQSISLLIAAALGALLGLERSVAGKQAGMRTYALVSLGSCFLVIIGVVACQMFAGTYAGMNPLQLVGSVIVGIGFIGSGLAVLRVKENHVELTTASGLWVVAGIGIACGFGLYAMALVTTVLAMAILSLLLHLENMIRRSHSKEQQDMH